MTDNQIGELYRQYVGGMDEWKIKLAIARILRFRVPQDAWEDTMQELAVVIHEFKFDSGKAHAASEKTILCRLLDNRIRMLARQNARRLAMLDQFSQMTQNTEDDHAPDEAAIADDVHQLISDLTPLQQEICRALMDGQSALQIAAATGRHYTTISRQMERIAEFFADRGMTLCRA